MITQEILEDEINRYNVTDFARHGHLFEYFQELKKIKESDALKVA